MPKETITISNAFPTASKNSLNRFKHHSISLKPKGNVTFDSKSAQLGKSLFPRASSLLARAASVVFRLEVN